MTRRSNPGQEIHEWADDEVLDYYDELMDIVRYGDVDLVTARDKRDFERLQAELIYRMAVEILNEDS